MVRQPGRIARTLRNAPSNSVPAQPDRMVCLTGDNQDPCRGNDSEFSIPTPTLLCNESLPTSGLNSNLPRSPPDAPILAYIERTSSASGISPLCLESISRTDSPYMNYPHDDQVAPANWPRRLYQRDELLSLRISTEMFLRGAPRTPETPNSVRVERYLEAQETSLERHESRAEIESSSPHPEDERDTATFELACDPGVAPSYTHESPMSESFSFPSQLQRIVRPGSLIVTYKYREDPFGLNMVVIDWTGALNARDQPLIGGDYARYLGNVFRVHSNGGLDLRSVDCIVAAETAIAIRTLFAFVLTRICANQFYFQAQDSSQPIQRSSSGTDSITTSKGSR